MYNFALNYQTLDGNYLIIKMKKFNIYLVIAVIAVMVAACGSKSSSNAPEGVETKSQVEVESEELQPEDHTVQDHTVEIREVVQSMYTKAMALYANNKNNNVDLSKIFYSNSFQELIRRTHKLEQATDGLILDWDLWVMAQDYQNPQAEVKDVIMTGQDKALANVVIKDNGERDIQVEIIREDGQWKINDLMWKDGSKWSSTRKMLTKALGD